MHVGVAGAGIGGPALAQALRARGVAVTVFGRDRAAGDTAGYRLHLDAAALTALRRVLPAGHLAARAAEVTAVAGTVPLGAGGPSFPRALRDGPAFAIGPGGAGVFLAAHLPGRSVRSRVPSRSRRTSSGRSPCRRRAGPPASRPCRTPASSPRRRTRCRAGRPASGPCARTPLRVLATGLVLPAVDRGLALGRALRGTRVAYPAAP